MQAQRASLGGLLGLAGDLTGVEVADEEAVLAWRARPHLRELEIAADRPGCGHRQRLAEETDARPDTVAELLLQLEARREVLDGRAQRGGVGLSGLPMPRSMMSSPPARARALAELTSANT